MKRASIKFKVETDTGRKVRVALTRRDPSGPFWYRFFVGKSVYRSSARMDERGAKQAATTAVLDALKARTLRLAPLMLPQAVTQYLAARWPGVKAEDNATYRNHKSRLRKLAAFAPEIDVGVIGGEEMRGKIQEYLAQRTAAGKAARTVVSDQLVFSRFGTWLKKSKLVTWKVNPAARADLDIEKPDDVTLPPLPEDEIAMLVMLARRSDLWPIIILCLGCGLRPREACRVEWSHVDLEKGTLRVFGKKRWRTITFGAWALKEVKRLWRKDSDGKLFSFNYFTAFDMMARLREYPMATPYRRPPLSMECSLQACRRTACRRAAQTMTMIDYANYFGHSLAVAHRHYLGYGLIKDTAALAALNFG